MHGSFFKALISEYGKQMWVLVLGCKSRSPSISFSVIGLGPRIRAVNRCQILEFPKHPHVWLESWYVHNLYVIPSCLTKTDSSSGLNYGEMESDWCSLSNAAIPNVQPNNNNNVKVDFSDSLFLSIQVELLSALNLTQTSEVVHQPADFYIAHAQRERCEGLLSPWTGIEARSWPVSLACGVDRVDVFLWSPSHTSHPVHAAVIGQILGCNERPEGWWRFLVWERQRDYDWEAISPELWCVLCANWAVNSIMDPLVWSG